MGWEVLLLVGSAFAASTAVCLLKRQPRAGKFLQTIREGNGDRGARFLTKIRVPWANKSKPQDMGLIATEVATRLQAGASVEAAWQAALRRLKKDNLTTGVKNPALTQETWIFEQKSETEGVPQALLTLQSRQKSSWQTRFSAGRGEETYDALPEMIVACRFTHALGAPLAHILKRSAEGIGEAGRAKAQRRVALAGPRTSVRILMALPLFGMLLADIVGGQPLAVMTDGALGSFSAVVGIIFFALGIRWSTELIKRAQTENQ